MKCNFVSTFVVVLAAVVMGGCASVRDAVVKWQAEQEAREAREAPKKREAQQKEFARLSSLPPAVPVASPHRDVAICAKRSSDLFNEVQPHMKAYVAMTETSLEYEGFVNDSKACAEAENISLQEAYKKIAAEVVAADANRPDDQKIWPKIEKGIAAANVLYAKTQSLWDLDKQIDKIKEHLLELKKAFSNGDPSGTIVRKNDGKKGMGKKKKEKNEFKKLGKSIVKELTVDMEYWAVMERPDLNDVCKMRVAECDAVYRQLEEAEKCLNVIYEQRSRVRELENYAR